MNSTAALPDALREALGQVIADQRREWRREREVIEAQSRQVIAELRAQILELQAELRAKVDARLAEVKDGATGERGAQGESGPQGIAGERGEPGPEGPAGRDGAAGERGEIGPVGERGEPGPKGETGERGDIGPDGPQGERGEPGPEGERGDQGPVGERGEPGLAGRDGAPGEIGPMGERGPAGERGEPGPEGERGERGADGLNGERGADGAPGKLSVAEDWCDRVYQEAETVVFDGALYQAQRLTGKAPPHDDWRCIARSGRDGADGRSLNPRSTWSAAETYARLDVVVLDGGAFVARRDDPGSCPGDGWQLLVQRGKPGRPGEKGDRGEKGIRGEQGTGVIGLEIDRNGIVTLTNADGSTATGDFYPVLSQIAR